MGYDEDTGQVQVEVKKWWPGAESNRRHRDFQSPALPTELQRHDLGCTLYPISRFGVKRALPSAS